MPDDILRDTEADQWVDKTDTWFGQKIILTGVQNGVFAQRTKWPCIPPYQVLSCLGGVQKSVTKLIDAVYLGPSILLSDIFAGVQKQASKIGPLFRFWVSAFNAVHKSRVKFGNISLAITDVFKDTISDIWKDATDIWGRTGAQPAVVAAWNAFHKSVTIHHYKAILYDFVISVITYLAPQKATHGLMTKMASAIYWYLVVAYHAIHTSVVKSLSLIQVLYLSIRQSVMFSRTARVMWLIPLVIKYGVQTVRTLMQTPFMGIIVSMLNAMHSAAVQTKSFALRISIARLHAVQRVFSNIVLTEAVGRIFLVLRYGCQASMAQIASVSRLSYFTVFNAVQSARVQINNVIHFVAVAAWRGCQKTFTYIVTEPARAFVITAYHAIQEAHARLVTLTNYAGIAAFYVAQTTRSYLVTVTGITLIVIRAVQRQVTQITSSWLKIGIQRAHGVSLSVVKIPSLVWQAYYTGKLFVTRNMMWIFRTTEKFYHHVTKKNR